MGQPAPQKKVDRSPSLTAPKPPKLPNAAWAWEFLRRNQAYARDFRAARRHPKTALRLSSGATLIRPRRRYAAAEKWGLIHFADPEKSALDADVFWRPDLLAGALNVRMSPVFDIDACNEEDHDIILLSAIKSRRVILDTVNGARHILLNGDRFWIQLVCEPPIPVGEQASVKIRIDGAVHARRKLDTAAQLLALHRSTGGQISLIGRNRNAEPLARALTAYDIWHGVHREKGGYRKIAEEFHGEPRVAEEWTHPSRCLKDQARRAVAKGEALVAGDYRDLLAKKAL